MGEDLQVSIAHRLETQLSQFPTNPARSFARLPEALRAELDLIRQYYVAYSRAQWALILAGTNQQFARGGFRAVQIAAGYLTECCRFEGIGIISECMDKLQRCDGPAAPAQRRPSTI